MKKIVVATNNAHKIEEIKYILRDFNIELLTKSDVGLGDWDVEETGATLEENALLKARSFKDELVDSDAYVLADDTGLFVEALDGAPGIYSARYAGDDHDDSKNNELLLKNLASVPMGSRQAEFRTVMAFIEPSGEEHVVIGRCAGEILEAPEGETGFGYDPLFKPNGFETSFSEMGEDAKNEISHRHNSLIALKDLLEEII